jgi:hypothetical protein
MGTIYLLCFVYEQGRHTPYRHAGHYMSWTQDLDARIEAHRAGKGARLIQVITAAGLGFVVARTWEGDRHPGHWIHEQVRCSAPPSRGGAPLMTSR